MLAVAGLVALAGCGDDDAPAADVAEGRRVFLGPGNCGECHALADAGTTAAIGANLDQSQPSAELVEDRVRHGVPTLMPAFEGVLTEAQIASVVAYVVEATAG